MTTIEEVEKLFELKTKELREILPRKYTKNVISDRNCAAWTVITILDILNMNDINIVNMASPLAGITRICGAVAGGLMMIGLIIGKKGKKEITQFAASAEGMKFIKRFEKNFNSIRCQDLTGLDLLTKEGMQTYIKEDVWGKKCYLQVVSAVEIIGSLYKEKIAKLI